MNLDAARVAVALARANAARTGAPLPSAADEAEAFIERHYRASEKLVIYGTLKPGERNHYVIEPIGGAWRDCSVHGTLHDTGWGAVVGFPAMRIDPAAPAVRAMLLESSALPRHWARLDRFEGDEYRRVLVPVHDGRQMIAIANIYEAREIPGR